MLWKDLFLARETHKDTAVSVWACQAGFWKSTGTSCQLRSGMDPSTEPTRSPISTNQRREMLLFLARIFGSHAGITNNGSAHTDSVRFCRFWFSRPRVKWLYGCLQGNRLRTISNSNLRIKLRHHWQNLGFVLSSFSPSVTLLSFFLSYFLSLYRLVRFMAFQSVLVGTTPAFTIIINSNKRSLLGQYIAILWSDLTALCNILRRFQR